MIDLLKPQIIIADQLLTHTESFNLVQWLQQQDDVRHIPLIVTSIMAEGESGLQSGSVRYLKKPITQERLQTTIDIMLGESGA